MTAKRDDSAKEISMGGGDGTRDGRVRWMCKTVGGDSCSRNGSARWGVEGGARDDNAIRQGDGSARHGNARWQHEMMVQDSSARQEREVEG